MNGDNGDPGAFSRYAVSVPLVDNSTASAYKVLIMGNSHASGLTPVLAELLALGLPNTPIDVQLSSDRGFLYERVNDGVSEQILESEQWTHVILQGQRYSTSGVNTYPTDAAEYWVRGSKLQGATPILFPEHPHEGNDWEARALWNLHSAIAARENSCVAPVGLVWEYVIFQVPSLVLHLEDGNHASDTGLLLTAMVFYEIITGRSAVSLPELSTFGIDAGTEQIMKAAVSTILLNYPACNPDR
ncbi:MAG: hypothetical protein KJO09_03475 [Gammaproteobacteria bacterium]|nr:hypothetical protein [Gammaproteobacteria bacterium]